MGKLRRVTKKEIFELWAKGMIYDKLDLTDIFVYKNVSGQADTSEGFELIYFVKADLTPDPNTIS